MTTGTELLVTWGDPPHPETVRELDDLEALLDRLRGQFEAAGEQHLVIIDNQVFAALLIGLGNVDSLLSWSDQDGGDLVSQGNGADEPSVAYLYNGYESEFSGTAAIPMEQARAAIRSFVATGERPSNVSWQEG